MGLCSHKDFDLKMSLQCCFQSTLNMLDERELERRSSCSASSSKSSMLVGEEEQVDNKMVEDWKCTQQNKMGEEEVIVTEEQVGDFLVHCYAQKEKETNLAIGNTCSKLQLKYYLDQGGRTWQPFVWSKNGNENFRQARIYKFRVKCVVFARNCKFAKLTQ